MTASLKVLQFKYDLDKQIDAYFMIRCGKELYFTSTGKLTQNGLLDYKERFDLNIQQILWDYWAPQMLGNAKLDLQRLFKERKDMHIIPVRQDNHRSFGELMIQLVFDEELISQQSSIKSSYQQNSSQQPSFVSSQGSSFYDPYFQDTKYINSSLRATQYKSSATTPIMQVWPKK